MLVWIAFLPGHIVMYVFEVEVPMFNWVWSSLLYQVYIVSTQLLCHFQPNTGYICTDRHIDFGNGLFWHTFEKTLSVFDGAHTYWKIKTAMVLYWNVISLTLMVNDFISRSSKIDREAPVVELLHDIVCYHHAKYKLSHQWCFRIKSEQMHWKTHLIEYFFTSFFNISRITIQLLIFQIAFTHLCFSFLFLLRVWVIKYLIKYTGKVYH